MLGIITIKNSTDAVEIDIEGVIGIPEQWQFDDPDERVATYDKFREQIKQISDIKATEVVVNIRSTGGDVNDALLIHDTIKTLNAKVTTRCYGYVASAATIIAQAASDGERHISTNSLYLIHRAMTCMEGNSEDLDQIKQLLDKTDDLIANLYASRSGKSADNFKTLMSENSGNGRWLSSSETIEHGLTDRIIDAVPINNLFSDGIAMFKTPNPPAPPENNLLTNQKNMKIKNTWNAILDFFGFDKSKDNELTEAQLEKLDNELSNKASEVTNLKTQVSDLGTQIVGKSAEITNLTVKLADLQSENDKLKASATQTEPKEDPAPHGVETNTRVSAYSEDIKNIKN